MKNHCELVRISIWKLHSLCKKVSPLKKNIKLRIEVAEDPQKHIFKVYFRFWVLFCIAIGRIVFFFQKAGAFLHRDTSWHFFEIHNANKKWFEISVFENSITQSVYKVVKEALKKSEKIHVVFFQVTVNIHKVVAKSKRVRYKRLWIIGKITRIICSYRLHDKTIPMHLWQCFFTDIEYNSNISLLNFCKVQGWEW